MVDDGRRAEGLATEVIAPMILGGTVRPQRPFGPHLAFTIGVGGQAHEGRAIVDNETRARVDSARLRVARSVVAVDVVPPLTPIDWAIACGLNDLMQVTNHELSSFATRGRHADLLDATVALCRKVPLCHDLAEAVGRHATFSRALEIRREDVRVSWWTGSDSFRGQEPPARLLAWPGLRNVQVNRSSVALADMAEGAPVDEGMFLEALGRWLTCSPLSDLATAHRKRPTFRWSAHSLSLVATVAGSNLALRALSHDTNDDARAAEAAVEAMRKSADELGEGPGRKIAQQFASWLDEAKHHWAEVG